MAAHAHRPARKQGKVLFVPGFVVDTYGEIEASFVDLCSRKGSGIDYVWLVPEVSDPGSRFVGGKNSADVHEPVWLPHLRENGIAHVSGNISRFNPIANARLFRKLFRENDIDAVFVNFGFERFWAALFAKLWGKKVIWTEHWHSLGTRYTAIKRAFYRVFVDEFIAVSRFIAGTLPRGNRIHTVPNAIAPIAEARRDETNAVWDRRLGLDIEDGRLVILMVAAFRPEKRHGLAVEICRKVLAARPDVHFVFLGEGAGRHAFQSAVEQAGLSGSVFAPGHVRGVDPFYRAADISMLTSLNEPFGYCVLEAMNNALPIVAFANGGPAEIIDSGNTGVLIAEGDLEGFASSIVDLVDHADERRRIGENARQAIAREFSREVWVERMNAIVRAAIGGRDARAGSGTTSTSGRKTAAT